MGILDIPDTPMLREEKVSTSITPSGKVLICREVSPESISGLMPSFKETEKREQPIFGGIFSTPTKKEEKPLFSTIFGTTEETKPLFGTAETGKGEKTIYQLVTEYLKEHRGEAGELSKKINEYLKALGEKAKEAMPKIEERVKKILEQLKTKKVSGTRTKPLIISPAKPPERPTLSPAEVKEEKLVKEIDEFLKELEKKAAQKKLEQVV